MLDCCPMCLAWFGVESGQDSHSVGNVWSGGNGNIEEGTNCTDVGHSLHLVNFFWSLGTLGIRKDNARIDWSGNRGASGEAISVKHVQDVLPLGKMNGLVGSVSLNLDSKEELNATKPFEFKVGL